MKKEVFIVDGLRTAIGGLGKSLSSVSAVDLAGEVIRELIERNKIDASSIDEVILGNTVSAGLGQNPARQALVKGGIPPKIPAFTVNKVCGSGLKSAILSTQAILCGDADIIIAGGTENVSQCPKFVPKDDESENLQPNSLINDGLWCNLYGDHMGMIAEYTAEKFDISREEQDAYALSSQEKAVSAQKEGLFDGEIVPVTLGDGEVFKADEKPRANTSMEKLSRIPSAFKEGGTVTAGNSPAPADGAAGLLLASEDGLKKTGAKPLARILGYATSAVEPELVFTAAGLAIEKCLKESNLDISDIDLFEINEAFAVQSLVTNKSVGLDESKLNVFGGTIALGHPLGASGARGLVTLLNALKVRGKKTGLTAVCLGGGCAVAMIVEIVK
ncbi:thiolase family protein [Candidatus Omnitrophota bacterium]